MVSYWWIEPNLEKIKTIKTMELPTHIKDV
jgi:hypothetical protein